MPEQSLWIPDLLSKGSMRSLTQAVVSCPPHELQTPNKIGSNLSGVPLRIVSAKFSIIDGTANISQIMRKTLQTVNILPYGIKLFIEGSLKFPLQLHSSNNDAFVCIFRCQVVPCILSCSGITNRSLAGWKQTKGDRCKCLFVLSYILLPNRTVFHRLSFNKAIRIANFQELWFSSSRSFSGTAEPPPVLTIADVVAGAGVVILDDWKTKEAGRSND